MRGTIRRLVTERGFGFLSGEDGKERFFHRTQTAGFDDLLEGDRVSFTPEDDNSRGPRALNVVGEPVAAATADVSNPEV